MPHRQKFIKQPYFGIVLLAAEYLACLLGLPKYEYFATAMIYDIHSFRFLSILLLHTFMQFHFSHNILSAFAEHAKCHQL